MRLRINGRGGRGGEGSGYELTGVAGEVVLVAAAIFVSFILRPIWRFINLVTSAWGRLTSSSYLGWRCYKVIIYLNPILVTSRDTYFIFVEVRLKVTFGGI